MAIEVLSDHPLRHGMAGTRQYMAPEIEENEPYSFPADMWSMSLTFYQVRFSFHECQSHGNNYNPKPSFQMIMGGRIDEGHISTLKQSYESPSKSSSKCRARKQSSQKGFSICEGAEEDPGRRILEYMLKAQPSERPKPTDILETKHMDKLLSSITSVNQPASRPAVGHDAEDLHAKVEDLTQKEQKLNAKAAELAQREQALHQSQFQSRLELAAPLADEFSLFGRSPAMAGVSPIAMAPSSEAMSSREAEALRRDADAAIRDRGIKEAEARTEREAARREVAEVRMERDKEIATLRAERGDAQNRAAEEIARVRARAVEEVAAVRAERDVIQDRATKEIAVARSERDDALKEVATVRASAAEKATELAVANERIRAAAQLAQKDQELQQLRLALAAQESGSGLPSATPPSTTAARFQPGERASLTQQQPGMAFAPRDDLDGDAGLPILDRRPHSAAGTDSRSVSRLLRLTDAPPSGAELVDDLPSPSDEHVFRPAPRGDHISSPDVASYDLRTPTRVAPTVSSRDRPSSPPRRVAGPRAPAAKHGRGAGAPPTGRTARPASANAGYNAHSRVSPYEQEQRPPRFQNRRVSPG